MDRKKLNKVSRKWYINNPQKTALYWEILKSIRSHEIGFIGKERPQRGYSFGKLGYLIGQLNKRYKETNNAYWHFYRSLEYIKIVDEDRKPFKLPDEWFPWGFDCVIGDIDCKRHDSLEKNISESLKVTRKMVKYLNGIDCPFIVKFSGKKGFHIHIPWNYVKYHLKTGDYPQIPKKLSKFVIKKSGLSKKEKELVDMNIYSRKRLYRTDYSLHPDTGLVALPLNMEQLVSFSLDLVEPRYVIENMDLKRRNKIINKNKNANKLFKDFFKENKIKRSSLKKKRDETRQERICERIKESYRNLNPYRKRKIIEELKKIK